jgi:hypothetical protein
MCPIVHVAKYNYTCTIMQVYLRSEATTSNYRLQTGNYELQTGNYKLQSQLYLATCTIGHMYNVWWTF